MEMTIDEHIEVLSSYNHGFTGYAGNLQDSIDVAMDIMRKYQRIQEIVVEMIQERTNALNNGDVPRDNTAVWIKREVTPRGYGEYLCNACMNENGTDLLTTYCPDCGAYHGKDKKVIKESEIYNGNDN